VNAEIQLTIIKKGRRQSCFPWKAAITTFWLCRWMFLLDGCTVGLVNSTNNAVCAFLYYSRVSKFKMHHLFLKIWCDQMCMIQACGFIKIFDWLHFWF